MEIKRYIIVDDKTYVFENDKVKIIKMNECVEGFVKSIANDELVLTKSVLGDGEEMKVPLKYVEKIEVIFNSGLYYMAQYIKDEKIKL
ncbi:hypothetical protein HYH96_18255 [Clostridium botulinum]|uniref:DUF2187 domain-containing protein n=3 Tax=Clostridium TaxID=1485 RepID=A0A6M0WM17_CLOBO|nr:MULTISPECIES: hypothetical protein [Clostridium]EKX79661.1 hypothetical protein CFSAN001628_011098 [Clostridium botulinum CFSAN001628]ACA46918.1 hypothetical protein CLD_A0023 [Clostridium botulinum B1 str. Okra]ACA57325.1 hypothetical protein CLK_A0171 [Clostridium botulinum A3 str. Loch Maree]APF25265.1 hypothetical protein NPD7_4012 [Clostridium sporogenes]APH15682.1 hypothetical protein NPD5_3791 [Clostridium sporogenes]